MTTEQGHYFPGVATAARLAYDAYWTAHQSEETASDACPQLHVDDEGVRLRDAPCTSDTPAGRAHRAAAAAETVARRLYDHLSAAEQSHLRATAAQTATLDENADDLTALARAVFLDAAGAPAAGTVGGRTARQQKSHDARVGKSWN